MVPEPDTQRPVPDTVGYDGVLISASGSNESIQSEEDDLLEIASGSSFCSEDDAQQLGAAMLETNLGEEFLSLFAPITDH